MQMILNWLSKDGLFIGFVLLRFCLLASLLSFPFMSLQDLRWINFCKLIGRKMNEGTQISPQKVGPLYLCYILTLGRELALFSIPLLIATPH